MASFRPYVYLDLGVANRTGFSPPISLLPSVLNFVLALLLSHITSDTVVSLGFASIRTGGTPYNDLKQGK